MKTTDLNTLTRLGLMPSWITYEWNDGDARGVGEYIENSMLLRWLGIILAILGLVGCAIFFTHEVFQRHPASTSKVAFGLMFIGLIIQYFGNRSTLGVDIRKLASALGVSITELLNLDFGFKYWHERAREKLIYAAAFILAAEKVLGSEDPIIVPYRKRFKSSHKIFQKFKLAEDSWKHYYDCAVGVELTAKDRDWLENERKLAFK